MVRAGQWRSRHAGETTTTCEEGDGVVDHSNHDAVGWAQPQSEQWMEPTVTEFLGCGALAAYNPGALAPTATIHGGSLVHPRS